MPYCVHRWSTVKRWNEQTSYYVIQRCRWCETWVRRKIELGQDNMNMSTEQYKELEQLPPKQIEIIKRKRRQWTNYPTA